MKKVSKIMISLLCAATFIVPYHNVSSANSSKETQVIINNTKLSSEDILLKNNQVFITLTGATNLDDLSFKWNNATKQVTIKGKETNLILTINKTTAQKNDKKIKMSLAPFIYNGKTMIPLRFVTEAMNSSVMWNPSSQTAYITKTSAKLANDFKTGALSTARNAAINIPRASQLSNGFEPTLDTFSIQYYFPEQRSDQFIEVNNNVVSYYKIANNTAYLKWQGIVGEKESTEDSLYFINKGFSNKVGTLPSFKDTNFASFRWMPHILTTGYGLINKQNWDEVVFKEQEVEQNKVKENYIIVSIPGE